MKKKIVDGSENQVKSDQEKCFADEGKRCSALTVKKCEGCNFYKPLSTYSV